MDVENCAKPGVKVITAEQCRAARGFLNWSKQDLADAAGVSTATIARLERMKGRLRGMIETEERIETALKERGIVFVENGILFKPRSNE